ncbi:hypothetical protein Pfo_003003 [Paulownia fortunei]|nr:hypothetical protein Pfo_003003 [Paulownia fortunei]
MRLVCKSWRGILMRADIPEAPWLILSNDSYFKPTEICFKSFSEERIYCFKLPNLEIFGGRARVMLLWNPISGATRKLPAISTLPFFSHFVDDGIMVGLENISSLTARVQVFSIGSVECAVAVLFAGKDRNHELALCTPQDQSWSVVGGGEKQHIYKDIFFHNGKLYASCRSQEQVVNINTTSTNGTVNRKASYTIHLTGCGVEVDMLGLMYEDVSVDDHEVLYPVGFSIRERRKIVEHLVESSTTGELLAVSAILDLFSYINLGNQGPIRIFICTQTRGFEVRRLAGGCLEKLTGIGGKAYSWELLGHYPSWLPLMELRQIAFTLRQITLVGYLGIDEEEEGNDDDIVHENDDAADNGDEELEDVLHEVDGEEEEEGNYEDIDLNRLYIVRERGVFYVQQNRIQTTYLTNLSVQSGSITGWFTPKLFQK